jgi:hypothetical protein
VNPRLQDALDALKLLSLVFESSGSRVARYEHNFQRVLGVPEQSAVLLGLLMLRGPQTAGELRINSERWYRFADISSVEAFLDELQDRSDGKGRAAGGQAAARARCPRAALGAPAVRPGDAEPGHAARPPTEPAVMSLDDTRRLEARMRSPGRRGRRAAFCTAKCP